MFPRYFAKTFGSIEVAIFLSQLIYWSDKGKREDGFIFKTMDEWMEETALTEYSIRKARNTLEKLGILETKVKKANGNPTVHYKINQEKLMEALL